MRLALAGTFFLSTALLLSSARADDPKPDDTAAQVKKLLTDAGAHWMDTDPAQCRDLLLKAYDLSPKDPIVLEFLSSFYDLKMGDGDKALTYIDQALRARAGGPNKQRQAEDLARKGNIVYSYKNDTAQALELYKSSLEVFSLSTTADTLSNLEHHLAGQETDPDKKKADEATALQCAKDAEEYALKYMKLPPERMKTWLAKVRIQLALCYEVAGDKASADATMANVPAADIDPSAWYNEAMLEAHNGNGAKALDLLHALMKKSRPTPAARNQLRKMIRTEADFTAFTSTDAWKDLVTDEPEAEGGNSSGQGGK